MRLRTRPTDHAPTLGPAKSHEEDQGGLVTVCKPPAAGVSGATARRGRLRLVPDGEPTSEDGTSDPSARLALTQVLERLVTLAHSEALESWGDANHVYLGATDAGLANLHADLSIAHGRVLIRLSRPVP